MITTGKKLFIALLLVPVSLVLMRFSGWFGVGFTAGIILSILYCIDYVAELRSMESPTKTQQFMLMLLTVPQVLFGLGVFTIGISITLWVLYNTFIERQPQYTGGFLTFGMAPAFILFGIGLITSAIKKGRRAQ
jgi:hypothetical protein